MDRTGLWGRPLLLLLLLLWVSGLRGEDEEQMCLLEGSNLTISCLYTRQYASSLKAWQRVRSRGPPETLVRTDTRNMDLNRAQAGRYLLEDDPTEGMFSVTVRELQRQDLGLYQCVIDLSPQTPVILPPRIRLVQCEDPASHTDPTQNLAQSSTLPPVTTMTRGRIHTSSSPVTQLLPMSTASLSSPGLGVNPTHGTDVPITVTRISSTSIITIVVCAILSKSLVFTFLLIATQRSFGH